MRVGPILACTAGESELLPQARGVQIRHGGKGVGVQGRETAPYKPLSQGQNAPGGKGDGDQMMVRKGPRMFNIWGQSCFKMRKCNTTQPSTRQMRLVRGEMTHAGEGSPLMTSTRDPDRIPAPDPGQCLPRQPQVWDENSGVHTFEPTSLSIKLPEKWLHVPGLCHDACRRHMSVKSHAQTSRHRVALFCAM